MGSQESGNAALHTQIANLSAQLATTQEQNKSFLQEKSTTDAELRAWQEKVRDSHMELNNVQREHDKVTRAAAVDAERAATDLDAARSQLSKAEALIAQLRIDRETASTELHDLRARLDMAESNYATAQTNLASARTTVAQETQRAQESQTALAILRREHEVLTTQVTQAQSTLATLQSNIHLRQQELEQQLQGTTSHVDAEVLMERVQSLLSVKLASHHSTVVQTVNELRDCVQASTEKLSSSLTTPVPSLALASESTDKSAARTSDTDAGAVLDDEPDRVVWSSWSVDEFKGLLSEALVPAASSWQSAVQTEFQASLQTILPSLLQHAPLMSTPAADRVAALSTASIASIAPSTWDRLPESDTAVQPNEIRQRVDAEWHNSIREALRDADTRLSSASADAARLGQSAVVAVQSIGREVMIDHAATWQGRAVQAGAALTAVTSAIEGRASAAYDSASVAVESRLAPHKETIQAVGELAVSALGKHIDQRLTAHVETAVSATNFAAKVVSKFSPDTATVLSAASEELSTAWEKRPPPAEAITLAVRACCMI